MAVSNTYRDAIDSIIQFFDRINMRESARMAERESGLFFNLIYFEDCFVRGAFEAAEEYFTGFIRVLDNIHSVKVLFELRWHKFLAALSENHHEEARVIIREKFQPLEVYHRGLIGFATHLVNLPNFRVDDAFLFYGAPEYHRMERIEFIRMHLVSNPLLSGKIRYAIFSANTMIVPPPIPAALPVPAASLVPTAAAPQPLALPAPGNFTVNQIASWFPRRT